MAEAIRTRSKKTDGAYDFDSELGHRSNKSENRQMMTVSAPKPAHIADERGKVPAGTKDCGYKSTTPGENTKDDNTANEHDRSIRDETIIPVVVENASRSILPWSSVSATRLSPREALYQESKNTTPAHPMQAAQTLFHYAQSQFEAEALQLLLKRQVTSALGSSSSGVLVRLANTPAYASLPVQSMGSTATNAGSLTQSLAHQSINFHLLAYGQLANSIAIRKADMLLAQQICLSAGILLDPAISQQFHVQYHAPHQHGTTLPSTSASKPSPSNYSQQPASSPASGILFSIQEGQATGTNRRLILYIPSDNNVLAENQITIRQNIELFEATQADVDTSVPGRRKPLVAGQVGIQCVHCSQLPVKKRKKGARYFPAKLDGIYQAAQNMAYCHLLQSCEHIDCNAKRKLLSFQRCRSNGHGGKRYWSQTAMVQGVSETDRFGLKFN